jgi:hypothetical protein
VTLICLEDEHRGDREKEALLQWLREGGRGRCLERMTVKDVYSAANDVVNEALQQGSLPSLKRVDFCLEDETHRASLSGGFLNATHELRLTVDCKENPGLGPQLAALGLVWQLPALTKLEIKLVGWGTTDPVSQWPPFIPPSLKALFIDVSIGGPQRQSLLRALPGVLGASGARLERLEILLPARFETIGDGLVHVAQALRCCSPTLKGFLLAAQSGSLCVSRALPDYGDRVEQLRVQWAGVLVGVSACRELQVLVLCSYIEVESLFPPGTAFARRTHLEISDHGREHPPDAGVMGLWELMASGGLPALAKLGVSFDTEWREEEVRSRVAPALEAVAGTLTHLEIHNWIDGEERRLGYELGAAMVKLRRLKDLALSLSEDGVTYQAFAQGLASSGGDRPLPLLWRIRVSREVKTNAHLLTSLLLPSVRVFGSSHHCSRVARLKGCALRQAGYKHTWGVECPQKVKDAARAIVQCRVGEVTRHILTRENGRLD